MNYVILALAFAGIIGCYDIAFSMTVRTRHSIRLAVIVISIGCTLAMLNYYDWALATVLAGCGLYRMFDKREQGWNRVQHAACGCGSHEPEQTRRQFDPGRPGAQGLHIVGGMVRVQATRARDVRVG